MEYVLPGTDSDIELQSREAEEAVIGAVLINPDVFHEVRLVLTEGGLEFFTHRLRFVWTAYERLVGRGAPIDNLTVSEELAEMGRLDEIGGPAYLMSLLNQVPYPSNAAEYAEILHRKHIRRKMKQAASEIARLAYDLDVNEQDVMSRAAREVSKVATLAGRGRMTSIAETVRETDLMVERRAQMAELPGVPTGLIDLDKMLGGGAQNSDLNIIAARPGWGKTSFLLQLLNHAALYGDSNRHQAVRKRVVMFTLEMPKVQLNLRLIAQLSGIDYQALRSGRIPDGKHADYYKAIDRLAGLEILIDDTPAATPTYMRSQLEVLSAERRVDVVFADSLNLMKSGQDFRRTDQETDYCATELKNIAREFDFPVWCAHQMNRGIEYRGKDAKPTLADLREGGEQPADGVIFIYHDTDDDKNFRSSSLIVAKQRNGPTGEIPVVFRPNATRFENAATVNLR